MAHNSLPLLTPNTRRRRNAPTDWTWPAVGLLALFMLTFFWLFG